MYMYIPRCRGGGAGARHGGLLPPHPLDRRADPRAGQGRKHIQQHTLKTIQSTKSNEQQQRYQ